LEKDPKIHKMLDVEFHMIKIKGFDETWKKRVCWMDSMLRQFNLFMNTVHRRDGRNPNERYIVGDLLKFRSY
jgi:hypothetical protein